MGETMGGGDRPDRGSTGERSGPGVGDDPGSDGPDGGLTMSADGAPPSTECFRARLLWSEDFESGDYDRWTGDTYGAGWGRESASCRQNGITTDRAHSGTSSQRSAITCASHESVHRGYGGLQFDGDSVAPAFTNTGTGIDAPNGVVMTFWNWLDAGYDFEGGRWFSNFTAQSDCAWGERVVTLGLENVERRLTPAHIWTTGGEVMFEPDAPAFPLGQWTRITVYMNYHDGVMHVWQDGESLVHATFSRPSSTFCHVHWGAYASGDNTDIVFFEDDLSVWKLEEPWPDMSVEPYFAEEVATCS
jgi:hypothetical protein